MRQFRHGIARLGLSSAPVVMFDGSHEISVPCNRSAAQTAITCIRYSFQALDRPIANFTPCRKTAFVNFPAVELAPVKHQLHALEVVIEIVDAFSPLNSRSASWAASCPAMRGTRTNPPVPP